MDVKWIKQELKKLPSHTTTRNGTLMNTHITVAHVEVLFPAINLIVTFTFRELVVKGEYTYPYVTDALIQLDNDLFLKAHAVALDCAKALFNRPSEEEELIAS